MCTYSHYALTPSVCSCIIAQCESEFVTKYFGSYLKGTKLWIVMEFLGGGSALDLVQ